MFYDLQTYKLNPLFIMLLVFATEAILWIYNRRKILGYFIIATFSIIFIIFEIFYFTRINDRVGIGYNSDFIPLIGYLDEEYPNKEIYMETDALQQYIYLLLAEKMSPYDFMADKTFLRYRGGEIEVSQVGRYHFLKFELNKDWIYVIEENNLFREENVRKARKSLEESGFSCEKYNNFLVYSYSNN